MANLHLLVSTVLMFVGQPAACVEWMIANPPIIFGETAQLSCITVTPNITYSQQSITSWLGGKHFSTLTQSGGTSDRRKYEEIRKWNTTTFESILQIYKFDEIDVNVNYSCSIGAHENRKKLLLASDKFEYHPDKDTTTVLTSLRNGYLDVIVTILKVYPIPRCIIMFNENIISQRLKTETSVNGIFYKVVEEAEHQVDVCSGQLIVTCLVGKTEIPIHKESFKGCTKTKEKSPENSDSLIFSITAGVLLFVMIVIGMGCLAIYGKLKNVLNCSVSWGREDTVMVRNVAESSNKFLQQGQAGATNDTVQEENRKMIPHSKQ